MPEPHEAAALERAFIEALRDEAAMPDPSWCLDETEIANLVRDRHKGQVPPRLAADAVAAAITLARALSPSGPPTLDAGFPVLLVRVSSSDWIEPMRRVIGPCLFGVGWRVHDGDGARGSFDGRRPREAIVFARDGSSREHRPSRGNDVVDAAILAGIPLIAVAADPGKALPRDLLHAVDREVVVAAPDAEALRLVIEAVTGELPAGGTLDADPQAHAPVDLRVGIRPGRSAAEALQRLGRARERERAGSVGPRLEETSGYGAAREWGLNLVADLRSWREGAIPFAACESAALLSGPPGTGKTRFAMSLARSAGLPLRAGSLAQWQGARDGHLGHTLGAMREFFEEARRSPCIVLIDEVDSFGDRNMFSRDHRDYSSQVVNGLLEHLDGAVAREGVVVIAATNHPSRIDPAITRAGRLERHFRIGLPDLDALAGMLAWYLGAEAQQFDPTPIVPLLRGMTGADVEAVVRRARGAARPAGRAPRARGWPPGRPAPPPGPVVHSWRTTSSRPPRTGCLHLGTDFGCAARCTRPATRSRFWPAAREGR